MKNIFTLLAVVVAFALGAQSLELVSYDDTVYYDPSIVNLDVPAHVEIKNKSSEPNQYMVKRNGPFDALCSTNYFCWDYCYQPKDDISTGSITLASNADTNVFSGHIMSSGSGVEGCCEIDYTFFNEFNVNDKLEVTVVFCGTNSISVNENMYSAFSVFPNPATNFVNIEYSGNKDGAFRLYNVVGQSVFSQTLRAVDQKTTVDVSSLNSGVYFYVLQIDGKVMETKKLIIK